MSISNKFIDTSKYGAFQDQLQMKKQCVDKNILMI